jgi:hypothetical protein
MVSPSTTAVGCDEPSSSYGASAGITGLSCTGVHGRNGVSARVSCGSAHLFGLLSVQFASVHGLAAERRTRLR